MEILQNALDGYWVEVDSCGLPFNLCYIFGTFMQPLAPLNTHLCLAGDNV
jgi:hypothetical protein